MADESPSPSHRLASRFQQMFPVLSPGEIDRIRRFGEVRRFPDGTFVLRKGEAAPGMLVILSGRVAIDPRDALGRAVPVEQFAELIGAPLEEMMEVVPGEVMAEIGDLTGRASPGVRSTHAPSATSRRSSSPAPRFGRCLSRRPRSASASSVR